MTKTETLLGNLASATSANEAGATAIKLLGRIFSAPHARRPVLGELPADAPRILGAIAASEHAARSGDLDLVLRGCGLPSGRHVLARFAGAAPPGPDDRRVDFVTADGPRPLPFWKLVDGAVHDGFPLSGVRAAIEALAPGVVEAACLALLHDGPVLDPRSIVLRIQQPNDALDVLKDDDDWRHFVRTLASILPRHVVQAIGDDAVLGAQAATAAMVVLCEREKASDATIATALGQGRRFAALVTDVVERLPVERRSDAVLAAVPEPRAPHETLDELALRWLAATPTRACAARLVAYARIWGRRQRGVPWDATAAAARAMGDAGSEAVAAARTELPAKFVRAVLGEAAPSSITSKAGAARRVR